MYISVAKARQRAVSRARAAGIPIDTLDIDNELEEIFVSLLRDSGADVSDSEAKTSEKELLDSTSFAWVPSIEEEDGDAGNQLWQSELPEDAIDPSTGQPYAASVSMHRNASRMGDDGGIQGRRRAVAVVSGLDPFAFPASQWAAKYKENMQSPSREQLIRGPQIAAAARSSMLLDDNFKKYIATGVVASGIPKERASPMFSKPTLVAPSVRPSSSGMMEHSASGVNPDDATLDASLSSNSNSVHYIGAGEQQDVESTTNIIGDAAACLDANLVAVPMPAQIRAVQETTSENSFVENEAATPRAVAIPEGAPTDSIDFRDDAKGDEHSIEPTFTEAIRCAQQEPIYPEMAGIAIGEDGIKTKDHDVDGLKVVSIDNSEKIMDEIGATSSITEIPSNNATGAVVVAEETLVTTTNPSALREISDVSVDASSAKVVASHVSSDTTVQTIEPAIARSTSHSPQISADAFEKDHDVILTGRFARPRKAELTNTPQALKKFQKYNEIPDAKAIKAPDITDEIPDSAGDKVVDANIPKVVIQEGAMDDSYTTELSINSSNAAKDLSGAFPEPITFEGLETNNEIQSLHAEIEPLRITENFTAYLPPLSSIDELAPKKPVSPITSRRKSSKNRQEIEAEFDRMLRRSPKSRFENPSVSLTMSKNPSVATAAMLALQLAESKSSTRLSNTVKRLYSPTGSRSLQSLPLSARRTPTGTIRPKTYLHIDETASTPLEDGNNSISAASSSDGFSAVLRRVVELSNGPLIGITGAGLAGSESLKGPQKHSRPPLGSTKKSQRNTLSSKTHSRGHTSGDKSPDVQSIASQSARLETDSLGSMSTMEPVSDWNVDM
jgi:hypothetical protein